MRLFWFLFAAALGAGPPAAAAEWGALGASLGLSSDYRYRGISNNDRDPALQGELAWSAEEWHAGIWASMVDFDDGQNARLEVDVSAGRQVTLRGTIVDLSVTYYSYPWRNRPASAPRYSYVEANTSVSHSWGDLTLSSEAAWSPNYFGETGTGWYAGLGAAYRLTDWPSISANIGRQWVEDLDAIPGSGFPYTHWDAGLTASLEQFW
ncbi:MAG: TorF family putative porin [Alphaproteobacteria bacterium]